MWNYIQDIIANSIKSNSTPMDLIFLIYKNNKKTFTKSFIGWITITIYKWKSNFQSNFMLGSCNPTLYQWQNITIHRTWASKPPKNFDFNFDLQIEIWNWQLEIWKKIRNLGKNGNFEKIWKLGQILILWKIKLEKMGYFGENGI